jgi:DNA-binding IclR family transcriptional regulator
MALLNYGSPLPIEFPGLGFLTHRYTLTEISRAVGLHDATVSRIIMALEKTFSSKMGPRSGRKQLRMFSLL